jgi:hypothetical protein
VAESSFLATTLVSQSGLTIFKLAVRGMLNHPLWPLGRGVAEPNFLFFFWDVEDCNFIFLFLKKNYF